MSDMCRCCECERVFHISEAKKVEEDRGEFWGMPAYETILYSPCCMSDFEEYNEEDEDEE